MLLTRAEVAFDFDGEQFDLERDRSLLAWLMSQPLHDGVAAIDGARWIGRAPDLDSAERVARQCADDLQQVRDIMKIFRILGSEPRPPDPFLRRLGGRAAARTWEEHLALSVVRGEGFALVVLYALSDTIPEAEVGALLEGIILRKEAHVGFGESGAMRAVGSGDGRRGRALLGRNLAHLLALRWIATAVEQAAPRGHWLVAQLPGFLRHANAVAEERLRRIGLLRGPLSSLTPARMGRLLAEGLASRILPRRPAGARSARLVSRYLEDPVVRGHDVLWSGEDPTP